MIPCSVSHFHSVAACTDRTEGCFEDKSVSLKTCTCVCVCGSTMPDHSWSVRLGEKPRMDVGANETEMKYDL